MKKVRRHCPIEKVSSINKCGGHRDLRGSHFEGANWRGGRLVSADAGLAIAHTASRSVPHSIEKPDPLLSKHSAESIYFRVERVMPIRIDLSESS